jgi:hypothetical protein
MSLPTSRNTTYAAGSQVKSADLNDLQDCIVDSIHSDRVLMLGAAAGQSAPGEWVYYSGITTTTARWKPTAQGDVALFPLPLRAGDRIRSIAGYIKDTTSKVIGVRLYKTVGSTAVTTTPTSETSSAGDASVQVIEVTAIDLTVADGDLYSIAVRQVSDTFTTTECYGASVTFDRPGP